MRVKKAILLITLTAIANFAFATEQTCNEYSFPESMTGYNKLPPNCTFKRSIKITSSNVTLDCNNSTLDGDDELKIGLLVDSQGEDIKNIKIKNCKLINFKQHGIRIGWNIPDGSKPKNFQENYSRTPNNIEIENVLVSSSGRTGIYIDDFVTKTTIKDSTVEKSRTAGIYLEHDSTQTTISNSRFINNGFTEDGKATREAIAIDSSPHNKIFNNIFMGNATGSIFLYKNCHEHASDSEQVPRQQEASYNSIINNTFLNEKIGIHIASRQSKNLSRLECGDPPMDNESRYYEDFSNHNRVESNSFCSVNFPIIIEGDFNFIHSNYFDQLRQDSISIPKTMREIFKNTPPVGNKINENYIKECGAINEQTYEIYKKP